MLGLDSIKTRLDYVGGSRQQDRMNYDKLTSLKRALLYSYQADTLKLINGDEFRCLINPDKTKLAYDDKILSVPFKDIKLNGQRIGKNRDGLVDINVKVGTVFELKDKNTFWLVTYQFPEETAYFRGEIRRCQYELDVDGKNYKVYVRDSEETAIDWNERKKTLWNNMNYDLLMMLTKDEKTVDFFHRFTKIKFNGNMWEVQAVDSTTSEGVISVCLKEYFNDPIHDAAEAEKEAEKVDPEPIEPTSPHIEGDIEVYPYDIKEYTIKNMTEGTWSINNKRAIITESDSEKCEIKVISAKSGSFIITYTTDSASQQIEVKILSL